MTVKKKVSIKPTEKYPLGHAKENKDASNWSYKFPESTGTAKDIGVYAQPGRNIHTGEVPFQEYATSKSTKDAGVADPVPNGVSYGTAREKTDGVTMRGYGAATKGIKSRGPMA
jgi:hypothetical protein